jgi:hypothetical protein
MRYCRRTALGAALAALLIAGVALAASPKANGSYAGRTSAAKIGGYPPPVSFTISANGQRVLDFNYATFACFTTYTKGTDPFSTGTYAVIASMRVRGGTFSISGAKDSISYSSGAKPTITTITKLSGHFTSPTAARGEISFTRTYKTPHGTASVCGSGTVTFTAKFTHVI